MAEVDSSLVTQEQQEYAKLTEGQKQIFGLAGRPYEDIKWAVQETLKQEEADLRVKESIFDDPYMQNYRKAAITRAKEEFKQELKDAQTRRTERMTGKVL